VSGSAQEENCTLYSQIIKENPPACLLDRGWNSLPDPNAPKTMACCNPGGEPFGEDCVIRTYGCGATSTSANDTPCASCSHGGGPIDFATGNTYIKQSDVSVPGLGGGLNLTRIWNSLLPTNQAAYSFMFGTNWRSTYEERLILSPGTDGYLKYLRSDGSVWSFGVAIQEDPTVYRVAAPADDTTTTIVSGSPNYTLTSKNGEKRLFDATTGLLTSIVDRNGNSTQLTYDSANRLVTVTDPASRHFYFAYTSPSSTLVSSVTSDVGISLSYNYDTDGRLTKVTKPDNTTVSFEYDVNSMITAVKDSDGKILESHIYDVSHRGLTSSRANGVESLTITYPHW
ncbi:MAG: DUF6531 domain-containing protein, partial [Candidatus Angelobacter sp.]